MPVPVPYDHCQRHVFHCRTITSRRACLLAHLPWWRQVYDASAEEGGAPNFELVAEQREHKPCPLPACCLALPATCPASLPA